MPKSALNSSSQSIPPSATAPAPAPAPDSPSDTLSLSSLPPPPSSMPSKIPNSLLFLPTRSLTNTRTVPNASVAKCVPKDATSSSSTRSAVCTCLSVSSMSIASRTHTYWKTQPRPFHHGSLCVVYICAADRAVLPMPISSVMALPGSACLEVRRRRYKQKARSARVQEM